MSKPFVWHCSCLFISDSSTDAVGWNVLRETSYLQYYFFFLFFTTKLFLPLLQTQHMPRCSYGVWSTCFSMDMHLMHIYKKLHLKMMRVHWMVMMLWSKSVKPQIISRLYESYSDMLRLIIYFFLFDSKLVLKSLPVRELCSRLQVH